MCAILISKVLRLARVLTRDHTVLPATHTFIHIHRNSHILPLLPSRRALPHFGRYSFPVLLRVGGSVGLFFFVTAATVTHHSF